MLGSSYTWSQADLEGLGDGGSSSTGSSSNNDVGGSSGTAHRHRSISSATAVKASSSPPPLHRQWSNQGGGGDFENRATPLSFSYSSSSSSSASSSSAVAAGGAAAAAAAQSWLRRTSTLVEESDPVVLSSSNRSNSLTRSASRSSNHWPDSMDNHPSPTSPVAKGSPWMQAGNSHAAHPHHPHHFVSTALYRSSSTSSPHAYSTSPSRFAQDFASSPRGLETMPEGIEHDGAASHMGYARHISHHHAAPQPPHRLRSSSSAAILGYTNGVPAHEQRYMPWHTMDNDANGSGNGSGDGNGDYLHATSHAHLNGHHHHAPDGGETARQSPQSPTDRRISIPAALTSSSAAMPNLSNFSPFRRDPAASQAAYPPGFGGHGTESRRHSASGPPVPVQRRAIGFELAGSSSSNNNTSDLINGNGGPTPKYTPHGQPSRQQQHFGASAFSEDDLAADLGQLNEELGKIQADQEHRDNIAAYHRQQAAGVHVRVPSSVAATTGAHAASMPPLFGDSTKAKYFSDSDWHAVLSPRSPSGESAFSSSPWSTASHQQQPQQHAPPPSSHVHGRQFSANGAAGNKSRSASVGPRTATPPSAGRGRADSVGLGGGGSGGAANGGFPPIVGVGVGSSASKLSPSASSFRGSLAAGEPGMNGAGPDASAAAAINGGHTGLGFVDDRTTQQQQQQQQGPPLVGQLNEFALTSLATLGPLPPNAGGGGGGGGAGGGFNGHDASGASNLQDLGRGIPLAHLPSDTPLYIVGFKQGRTDLFYRALIGGGVAGETPIHCDDLVIVEADRGKDLGRVVNDSLTVEQVRLFLAHQQAADASIASHPLGPRAANAARTINPKRLYSKATPTDSALLATKSLDEEKALDMCIQKVQQRGLTMHVLAAELQWDRRKLTFYYTAVSRVDFRALVAELFKIFKMRIWMCQIAAGGGGGGGGGGGAVAAAGAGGGGSAASASTTTPATTAGSQHQQPPLPSHHPTATAATAGMYRQPYPHYQVPAAHHPNIPPRPHEVLPDGQAMR